CRPHLVTRDGRAHRRRSGSTDRPTRPGRVRSRPVAGWRAFAERRRHLALGRRARADDESLMLKGAIIGFGQAAQHGHWPAYTASRQLSIAAVVDRTPQRREAAARLLPSVRTYASFDRLAAEETIDFIDICTPPAVHHEPMLAA